MAMFQMEGRDSLDLLNLSDGHGDTKMPSLFRKFELRREGKCPRCECVVDVNSFRDELSRRSRKGHIAGGND